MEINSLVLGPLGTNCYLVSGEKGAVVIDPGFKSDEVKSFLEKHSDKERMIILTHAHFDHIGAAPELQEELDIKIAIGEKDNPALADGNINMSIAFNFDIKPFSADILLKDGEILNVGDLCFKIIETPGHTVGGISLLSGDVLFSGDTLFYESVGRTDLPGGDFNTLLMSLERLFELDENTKVYSGHGVPTTINHEKNHNPYRKK